MYRVYLFLSYLRKRKNQILTLAAVAVFAFFIILFLVQINKLNEDIQIYESEISYLQEKHADYEAAIGPHGELLMRIEQLEKKNDELEGENLYLQIQYNELADEKYELERQNGELLKKLDGLRMRN